MRYLVLFLLATSVAGFDYEFHRFLDRSHKNKNLIGSSYLAKLAIGMLNAGAAGDTAEELWSALDLANNENVEEKFEKLRALHPYAVEVNNYLIVNSEYSLFETYMEKVEDLFQATFEFLDFSNPQAAVRKINQWVNNQSHGRVQKLISSIGNDTKGLLINAIYFKAQWAKKFNPELTQEENFHVSATKKVPVQMMAMRGRFKAEGLFQLDAKVIELPFTKEGLVMLIYLPNTVSGLEELEAKVRDYMRPKKHVLVNLRLPKFRISTKTKLKPVFQLFGIEKAFQPSANLSGMVDDLDFYINDVIQEAFIEVNEDGVEATSAIEGRSSAMDFIVNVPFAYVIRDCNQIYFQGHVTKPEWF